MSHTLQPVFTLEAGNLKPEGAAPRHSWRAYAATLLTLCFIAGVAMASPVTEDAEFFLMDVIADDHRLAESVPSYRLNDTWFVHFPTFLAAVEFPIAQENGAWTGWFRSEESRFSWEVDRTDTDTSFESGEGTFVSLAALETWFRLDLTPKPRTQAITVSSEEPLPFQKRKARASARIRHQPRIEKEVDVRVRDQYRWATVPLLDVSTSYRLQDDGEDSLSTSQTSLTAGMDLLKHSVMYSGSTASDSSSRLTVARSAAVAAGTLGLGIDHYAVGDIIEQGHNLVAGGGRGAGFRIARRSSQNNGNRGRVTITGEGPPGWDAELYRNRSLLTFGTVGADGRFVFPDQELVYGENVFVVKLLGSQGQIREVTQTFWGGGIDLEPGSYSFSISRIDFSKGAVGGHHENSGSLPSEKATAAHYARAVTEDLQLGLGYTRARVGSRIPGGSSSETDYATVDGRINTGSGLLLGEFASQRSRGSAWSLTYLTGLGGHNAALSHQAFRDFESPYTFGRANADSETQLTLSGPLDLSGFHSYTLRLSRKEHADGPPELRIFSRLGAKWGAVNVSNDLDYARAGGEELLLGRLRMTGRWNRLNLRAQLDYDPSAPDPLNQISAMVQWNAGENIYYSLSAHQDLKNDRILHLENMVTARLGRFDLSFSLHSRSDDFWAVGVTLGASFGSDSETGGFAGRPTGLAHTGRATLNFFIDSNNNGVRDSGEHPVSWAAYKQHTASEMVPGAVQLNAVPPHIPLRIDSSDFRFQDPFLVAREEVYELYTHPGSNLEAEIPVVNTGDVEGHLYPVPGRKSIVSGVDVVLYRADGQRVASTRSEFDGYYSFHSIAAGNYEIVVQGSSRKAEVHRQRFSLDPTEGFVPLDPIFIYWN